MQKVRSICGVLVLGLITMLVLSIGSSTAVANTLRLVIDGQRINSDPQPVLHQGRTLVPVRLVAERLGAEVEWIPGEDAVRITQAGRSVFMRLDSHLVEVSAGAKSYLLSDVAPMLINGRTYVPLRLVGNALGVEVRWDEPSKTVHVDSRQSAVMTPFYNMRISSVSPGQTVTGKLELKVDVTQALPRGAKEIRYLLLSPDTGRGEVVARGTSLTATYSWVPDMRIHGPKVLIAAIYDAQGRFLAGDAMPVEVAAIPQVSLKGLTPGQVVQGAVTLSPTLNFSAAYVTYEVTNLTTGQAIVSPKSDPLGTYTFTPMREDNGEVSFRVAAYTAAGVKYGSEAVTAMVNTVPKAELRGAVPGATIEKPINLSVYTNFAVQAIEYVLRDLNSGQEQLLASVPQGGFRFLPSPALAGRKEFYANVTDALGFIHTTQAVQVNISGKALLTLSGIGPNQVVTAPVNLSAASNIPLEWVRFIVTDKASGVPSEVGTALMGAQFSFSPAQAGDWSIRAEGIYSGATVVTSESISFRVYLGTVYGPRPIVPREQFLGLAQGLAIASRQQTGMSAALQTAQAILETGWGQSVPVDKYSGVFSNNLFGIKGNGPAGSVISNTWEEYNGVAFRIDANFRAYHALEQGWDDHKSLLLTASRYQPYREVMHDSILGAWALRRAGYATDSQYPIKLIDIINRYDLWKLDEVKI